jgi:hypothetical protein
MTEKAKCSKQLRDAFLSNSLTTSRALVKSRMRLHPVLHCNQSIEPAPPRRRLQEKTIVEEMTEVTKAYFQKVIHPLNVHVCSFENHTEWKLNGTRLVAKTTPGYLHPMEQEKYFVISEYSPKGKRS